MVLGISTTLVPYSILRSYSIIIKITGSIIIIIKITGSIIIKITGSIMGAVCVRCEVVELLMCEV